MEHRISRRAFVAASGVAALSLTTGATVFADEASPVASPGPTLDAIPDSPAGRQLLWILSVINDDGPIPDDDELRERFTPAFVREVPVQEIADVIFEIRSILAPLIVDEILGEPISTELSVAASAQDGVDVIIDIAVEPYPPYPIDGLLFSPADLESAGIPPLTAWSELETALQTENGTWAVHVARLEADESLTTIHEANAGDIFAIGSIYKLYVLGALALEIEAGRAGWDDEVVVREELISLPSGITQDAPPGSRFTLDEMARRMISISDNTATDLIMHAIGRDRVEAVLATMGNSALAENAPFLFNREQAILKLSDPERRAAYVAGDEAERRDILESLSGEPLPPPSADAAWLLPIEIETIEWYASMVDLALAQLWLRDAARRPGLERIDEIMSLNSGVIVHDRRVWDRVAFKGGSEPGVNARSWLLERADGAIFTFSAAVNDPTAAIDTAEFPLRFAGAFRLLELA